MNIARNSLDAISDYSDSDEEIDEEMQQVAVPDAEVMPANRPITPPPFFQVYVVLAERDGYVFPVLYGLLPDKTQVTYERLFRMIKNIWPEFAPSSFSVDYEIAVINALEVVFRESEIFGCLFHLVQNLKKHLAFHHLKGRYETDADFAVKCRMITAMAFVRPDEIMPVFEELEEILLGEIDLDPILAWFKKTYVGHENRRGIMSPPLFAHSIWNVYDRTLNGDHRTNNFAEAANHRIQTELDVSHPGLWTFIKCLQSVQQGRDQKYLQWMAGKEPKGKRQSTSKLMLGSSELSRITKKEKPKNI
uniref:MULE transposase domain-containing protein n=1 Tax=Ditylenchus dipsaci TaxID=166011 RepID=A0A915E0L8_9BILA